MFGNEDHREMSRATGGRSAVRPPPSPATTTRLAGQGPSDRGWRRHRTASPVPASGRFDGRRFQGLVVTATIGVGVECKHRIGHRPDGKTPGDGGAKALCPIERGRGVGENVAHRLSQFADMPGGDETRIGAGNDLGHTAHIRRNERQAGAGRLERDIGKALGSRRHDQNAAERKGLARRHGTGKGHVPIETQRLRLGGKDCCIGAGADDDNAAWHRFGDGGRCPEKKIHTLEAAKLADKDKVGRIRRGRNRFKFLGRDAVMDDAGRTIRYTDLCAIGPRGVGALEQQTLRRASQIALGGHEKLAFQGRGRIMQAAAVGGIERSDGQPAPAQCPGGQARVGAPLGAVAVNDIGTRCMSHVADLADGCHVTAPDLAGHGNPAKTQRQIGRQRSQAIVRQRIAAGRIADEANSVTAVGLLADQIPHMTEETADRRTQAMKDPFRGHAVTRSIEDASPHRKRSWTRSVSPGLMT